MVRAPEEENLRLESLSHGIVMNSPEDILMDSYGGSMKIKSLSDMKFTSKNGKVSSFSFLGFIVLRTENSQGIIYKRIGKYISLQRRI